MCSHLRQKLAHFEAPPKNFPFPVLKTLWPHSFLKLLFLTTAINPTSHTVPEKRYVVITHCFSVEK